MLATYKHYIAVRFLWFPEPSRALNCYKNLNLFIDFSRKIRNFIFPQNFEFWTFWEFWDIYKKTRAEISRKTHRRMPRDLSYETDSGPKTKTENRQFFGPLKNWTFFKASKANLGIVLRFQIGEMSRDSIVRWLQTRKHPGFDSSMVPNRRDIQGFHRSMVLNRRAIQDSIVLWF